MTGRRRFGRIRRLPSGRWQARYPDGSGRDVPAPMTFALKGDAARWLVEAEADLVRGQFVDPRAGLVTFARWAGQWLDRPGKRANSVARDRQGLEAFMVELGHRPLSSITPMHIQTAVDARSRVVSPATLVRDIAPLRAVFNAAVDADELDAAVKETVERLAKLSPAALAVTKKAVYCWDAIHFDKGLTRAEQIYLEELMKTEDAQEGIRAWMEKREPSWKAR